MSEMNDFSERLPDEIAEAIRQGMPSPVAEDVATAHLAAIASAVPPPPAVATTPATQGLISRIRRRLVFGSVFTGITAKIVGAGVALATVTGGVTATGALPDPIEDPLAVAFEVVTLGAFPDLDDDDELPGILEELDDEDDIDPTDDDTDDLDDDDLDDDDLDDDDLEDEDDDDLDDEDDAEDVEDDTDQDDEDENDADEEGSEDETDDDSEDDDADDVDDIDDLEDDDLDG